MATRAEATADVLRQMGQRISDLALTVNAVQIRVGSAESNLAATRDQLGLALETIAEYENLIEANSQCLGWVAAHSPEHPDPTTCPTAGELSRCTLFWYKEHGARGDHEGK
jgi:hypothetical protein